MLFAWFAFGSYVVAFASGVLYLLKGWGKVAILTRLPELKLLDELSFRLILFGVLAEAIMIGSGAIWARGLWGRYWAWDPVENAGLLPWFTATAFLHSIIIQEQRGMLRVWNLALVIITFFLTIFGTFMTRSGIVQSVHAFGEDNELALLFVLFMVFIFYVVFVTRAGLLG